jgi:hypothetical protein
MGISVIRRDARRRLHSSKHPPKMPEPFTPNNPCPSSMEVPYRIVNIQSSMQLLKRGDYLLVEGRGNKNAVGECSNGFL